MSRTTDHTAHGRSSMIGMCVKYTLGKCIISVSSSKCVWMVNHNNNGILYMNDYWTFLWKCFDQPGGIADCLTFRQSLIWWVWYYLGLKGILHTWHVIRFNIQPQLGQGFVLYIQMASLPLSLLNYVWWEWFGNVKSLDQSSRDIWIQDFNDE